MHATEPAPLPVSFVISSTYDYSILFLISERHTPCLPVVAFFFSLYGQTNLKNIHPNTSLSLSTTNFFFFSYIFSKSISIMKPVFPNHPTLSGLTLSATPSFGTFVRSLIPHHAHFFTPSTLLPLSFLFY
jgi:hypothetical protein